ncbi:hypothetical protein Hte_004110 [Hypoxylon texense]
MASQPQLSRVGKAVPSDGNSSEAFSSSTQLPGNNNNPIHPRIGTVEELPSSTVDHVNLEPNPSSAFTFEPQRPIIEMERDSQRVLTTAFKERLVPTSVLLSRAMQYGWNQRIYRSFIFLFCIALVYAWYLVIIIPVVFVLYRHCVLVFERRRVQGNRAQNGQSVHGFHGVFLFVCGSGGHTNEMLRMLERSIRADQVGHRRWAVGSDDRLSFNKVLAFERRIGRHLKRRGVDVGTFNIMAFNRAREVHQGWVSTTVSTIKCLCDVIEILFGQPTRQWPYLEFPNVIVSNGPGTGFLFLLVAHVMKIFYLVPEPYMKTVYVESWARVNTLSLSAKLVRFFQLADVFIVQHIQLASRDGQDFTSNVVAMPTEAHVQIPRND